MDEHDGLLKMSCKVKERESKREGERDGGTLGRKRERREEFLGKEKKRMEVGEKTTYSSAI